jgi:hypothetical protein
MVPYTLPNSQFSIAFLRGGEVLDVRPAPTGERAVKCGRDGPRGGNGEHRRSGRYVPGTMH